jgi:hypothetical protein
MGYTINRGLQGGGPENENWALYRRSVSIIVIHGYAKLLSRCSNRLSRQSRAACSRAKFKSLTN